MTILSFFCFQYTFIKQIVGSCRFQTSGRIPSVCRYYSDIRHIRNIFGCYAESVTIVQVIRPTGIILVIMNKS